MEGSTVTPIIEHCCLIITKHSWNLDLILIYIYRVYTVIRLRGRTPDAGSDPPFAPPCKREYTAPIAGSDPPFALLLKGRVRPQMRGLTRHLRSF